MQLPAPLARISWPALPWPIWAALVSAAMLATAHTFQHFGYDPCGLCLRQREVYWAALGLAVAGLIAAKLRLIPAWLIAFLLGGLFAVGAVVAAYHAGVEWKWWPGPAACSSAGPATVTSADLMAILDGAKVRAPACDEAAWRMAGLSMAGWNALVSLALAAISFAAARKEQP